MRQLYLLHIICNAMQFNANLREFLSVRKTHVTETILYTGAKQNQAKRLVLFRCHVKILKDQALGDNSGRVVAQK